MILQNQLKEISENKGITKCKSVQYLTYLIKINKVNFGCK